MYIRHLFCTPCSTQIKVNHSGLYEKHEAVPASARSVQRYQIQQTAQKAFLAPSRGAGRLQRSSFLVYILSLKPAAEASNGHESGADLLDHLSAENVELFLFSTLHSAAEAAVRNQANVLKHSRAPRDGRIPVGHYYLMFYTSLTDGDCIENYVC